MCAVSVFEIVLVEPEIPPNTGNVGRLCVALGAHLHLIEPLGFEITDKQVRRAGLDYWKDLDLTIWPSFEAFEAVHSQTDRWHLFSARAGTAAWSATYQRGDVLIFGPETRGLDAGLLDRLPEQCRTLPTPGYSDGRRVRSINLSAAVAAAAYMGASQIG